MKFRKASAPSKSAARPPHSSANKSPYAASPHPALESLLRASRTYPHNPPASAAPHETTAQAKPPRKQTPARLHHISESIAYLPSSPSPLFTLSFEGCSRLCALCVNSESFLLLDDANLDARRKLFRTINPQRSLPKIRL